MEQLSLKAGREKKGMGERHMLCWGPLVLIKMQCPICHGYGWHFLGVIFCVEYVMELWFIGSSFMYDVTIYYGRCGAAS